MKRILIAALASAAVPTLSLAAEPDPHAGHAMPGMVMPEAEAAGHEGHGAQPPAGPDAGDHAGMAGMSHEGAHGGAHEAGHAMPYAGTLGFYPMSRDASGTAWQPDESVHEGLHGKAGDWTLMGHARINAVYDRQGGERGGERAFLAGMVMGAARRDFANGDVLNLRAMLSPDPLMGARGYPLLLAAGETADGKTTLVDRQHPHDLFMELSASYSKRLSVDDAVFVYAGLPGEPAFGPPTFMHRLSGSDSPEAPIAHHWLDSTHITFGVVTAGWTHRNWKVEASRFNGREPDQRRWNIETGPLTSSAVRLSWNPVKRVSLQASWAELIGPEALEPDQDERRWSASAIYTAPFGTGGWWSVTGAWGRKMRSDGTNSDAWVGEAALKPNADWTVFSRAERLQTDELHAHAGATHGDLETVGKVSLGLVRDVRVADHLKVGFGGVASVSLVPAGLEHAYGSDPKSFMLFTRLTID